LTLEPLVGVGARNLTDNQRNVANAVIASPPKRCRQLFGLICSNFTHALDQISDEAATGAQQAAFQLGGQFLKVMLDPFVDGRCGITDTEPRPAAPARGYFKAAPMSTTASSEPRLK